MNLNETEAWVKKLDWRLVLAVLAFFGIGSVTTLLAIPKQGTWYLVKDYVRGEIAVYASGHQHYVDSLLAEDQRYKRKVMERLIFQENLLKNMFPKAYEKTKQEMAKWNNRRDE